MSREFIRELRCRKCGKNFCPAPQHMYKDGKGMYCSWTCYNHRDECDHRKTKKVIKQYTMDGELLATFRTCRQAADAIDGYAQTISIACKERRKYKGYLWKYGEGTDDGGR